MHGYQITFFTQQDRPHGQQPLAQWLLHTAQQLGIRNATLSGALQGVGHDGTSHAVTLFDLADQPLQVTLVVSESQAECLLNHLLREKVHLFYVKTPVEFGTLGIGSTLP